MTTCHSNTCATEQAAAATTKPRFSTEGGQDATTVRVELPGVKKDGVDISVDDGVLSLRAKRASRAPADWKTLHRELDTSDYLLRLKLNGRFDESKLTAALDEGVLTLRLPVKEAAKPRLVPVA